MVSAHDVDNRSDASAQSNHFVGVDGLRGLCISAVLVYHYWVKSLPGGFLGVSTFFTISGFVITSSLLAPKEARFRARVREFWVRRVRRLWPAAALTLTITLLIAHVFGWTSRSMASDGLASFFQWYNWRVIATGTVYGQDLPSIFGHFWSLSIESQYYVIAPLFAVASLGRKRIHFLFHLLVILVALVVSLSVESLTFVYSSSVTRAGEISMGALLALLSTRLPRLKSLRFFTPMLDIAGVLALVVLGWIVYSASMSTPSFGNGGLLGISLLSVTAVAAAAYGNLSARSLSFPPLVWLGRISYSLYLVHFPVLIFVIWSGVDLGAASWLALAISLIVATAMHHLVENPFRRRRFSVRTNLLLASLIVASFISIQIAIRRDPGVDVISFEAQQESLASITGSSSQEAGVRVAIFGDSTAVAMSLGLQSLREPFEFVGGYAELGCPIGEDGLRRGMAAYGDNPDDIAWPVEDVCDRRNWIEAVRRIAPVDVAIVLAGNWDLVGRQIAELGSDFLTITDSSYRSWLGDQMTDAVEQLKSAGADQVLWLTLPANTGLVRSDRLELFNRLVVEIAASRPWISVADYATFIENHPELRPDGIHLSPETSPVFVDLWLKDQLLAVLN